MLVTVPRRCPGSDDGLRFHKSQESEFPAVVIPIASQHYMLLKRNLIYTGITRGKKLVVLAGQKKERRRWPSRCGMTDRTGGIRGCMTASEGHLPDSSCGRPSD